MRIIEKDKLYDVVKNQNKKELYNLLKISNDTGMFYPNDNYGYETLLHLNAKMNEKDFDNECFEILCFYSTGYVNLKDSYNRTPLFLACMNNNIEAIKTLISYNADFTLIDSFGRKAFDYVSNPIVLSDIEEYFLNPFSKKGNEIKGVPYWLDEFKSFVFSSEKEEMNFLINLLMNRTKDVKEFLNKLEGLNIRIYIIVDEMKEIKDIKFIKQNINFLLSDFNPKLSPQKLIRKLDLNYNKTLSLLLKQNMDNDIITSDN